MAEIFFRGEVRITMNRQIIGNSVGYDGTNVVIEGFVDKIGSISVTMPGTVFLVPLLANCKVKIEGELPKGSDIVRQEIPR